jgi:hypothetical protein
MFFAEVRPFEEIFRESSGAESNSQQQQQGQQQNPATRLLELQKQVVSATWNLQRRETEPTPGSSFKKDTEVVHDSQQNAWQQAQELKEKLRDEKSHAILGTAIKEMDAAAKSLADAASKNSVQILPNALESEQNAYQALLKLQAREYQVSRSRNQKGSGQSGAQQRAQRQLDQLELKNEENRYETESEAKPLQTPEQRESLQVLSRLQELARRQQDMSERLKELQSAINEAKTPDERQKLERMLKRLQEEQQQIVQDMDEVRQRMAQPENQSRMADAQQKLDQTRQQSRDAAQQLDKGNLSQALSSSSRASRDLQQLSDQFRKSTSSQFSEEMRQMRQQARELEKKENELAQKFDEMNDTREQRTLSSTGPKQEIADAIAQQRAALTNILQNMRQISEHAEAAEPLLSRQLYDTYRHTSQQDPDKQLETASRLLDRNNPSFAREAEKKADETIKTMKEGIERAASSVLGDEAESLRYAEKELKDLSERVQREMMRASGMSSTNLGTNGIGQLASRMFGTNGLPSDLMQGMMTNGALQQALSHLGQTNSLSTLLSQAMTNRALQQQLARAAQGLQNGNRSPQPGQQGQRGQNGEDGNQQLASAQAGNEQGNSSQQQNGQQNGQQGGQRQGRGQRGNQQQGAPAQNGQSGQGQNGQQQNAQGQQGQQGQGEGQGQSGQQTAQAGGQRGGGPQANFFDNWGGANNGGGRGGDYRGPLTGGDYTRWSDRLRDVEEILQDPQLRTGVAQVREKAREMRFEFTKHGENPKWDLVDLQVVTPLHELHNRVAEELAKLGSKEAVVPVDRDPVPQKYSDLVSHYYERLGKE